MALKLYGVLLYALLSIFFVQASEKSPQKLAGATESVQSSGCLSDLFTFLRQMVQQNYSQEITKISEPHEKEVFITAKIREIIEFPMNNRKNALIHKYSRLLDLLEKASAQPQKYQERVKFCLSKYNDAEWQNKFKAEFDAQRMQRNSWCVIL